ncbi:hypothetical protein V8E55_001331, partial [Tylopilus felleus]
EWRQHSATLIEGTRKPDVILVPSCTPESLTFREVYSYCELKYAFTKDLSDQALFQLMEIAGFAVAAQLNRRFFVASALCGSMFTLGFFARGSVVFSRAFDIHEFPVLFLTVLIGLSSADHTWNGFDHAMRPCGPPNSFTIFQIGNLYGVTLQNLLLYASSAMQSRGTKVPLCKATLESMTGPELNCVLKLSWLPEERNTDIEVNELINARTPRRLTEEEHRVFGPQDEFCVFRGCIEPRVTVEHTQWDDVRHLPGIPIVVPVDKDDQGKPVMGPVPLYQEPRRYIGVVSRTCGAPLVWFSCRRELADGLMGGLIAHFNGLRKDILHCDVSEMNLWFRVESPGVEHVVPEWPKEGKAYPKRAGMLGDWGYAEDLLSVLESRLRVHKLMPFQGTFPFMASELLSKGGMKGNVTHRVDHDLESFFWVLWVICVNMDGPYYTRRIWQDEREDLTREALPNARESGAAARRSASRSAAKRSATPVTPSTPAPCARQLPDGGSQPPVWATPGVHECGAGDVSEWKRNIPTPWFYDCLSPYFRNAGEGFRDGLLELRDHFAQDTKKEPITHATFLRILKDMRDSIPAEIDRPSGKEIREARSRYETLLRVGGVQGIAISALDALKPRNSVSNSAAKRQAENLASGSASKKLRSSGR